MKERVVCLVDGFNVYHALHDLKLPHIKWLNLHSLFQQFVQVNTQSIEQIFFFSAYPTWKLDSYFRHRQYIKALEANGVTVILGKFKEKPEHCKTCKATWIRHEEKESDVNLALKMVEMAFKNQFDHAFLFSRDSDLSPAVRMVKQNFPNKKVTVFTLFNYRHSSELISCSDRCKTIQLNHLLKSLLPEVIYDKQGKTLVARPSEYAPFAATDNASKFSSANH